MSELCTWQGGFYTVTSSVVLTYIGSGASTDFFWPAVLYCCGVTSNNYRAVAWNSLRIPILCRVSLMSLGSLSEWELKYTAFLDKLLYIYI